MKQTYRALQLTEPGKFELVQREVQEPGKGQVRLRVEAAGICHSDSFVIEGYWPGIVYPRVPGHEIAGRIDAIGESVSGWKVGQRVGVGWFGGNCGQCEPCRRGNLVYCRKLTIPGINTDGGYAEMVIVDASSLAAVPEELSYVDAAPLLCAGVTSFNALRNSSLRAGSLVAIHGIGGLGHLAVQYARHMGFHTVAIARGAEKKELALKLGAHKYIDASTTDAAQALRDLGGAGAILTTVSDAKSMSDLIPALAPKGKFILLGLPGEPVSFLTRDLIDGGKAITGELTGTAMDEEDTLSFSALQNIRPQIETVSLEEAPEAYRKMMRNEARFRMVIHFA
jgi:D-arabinose 1-dehydrogenase-like Zn-dependent alcohol dehydrogenase